LQRHHHFFERGVAGALANAVDRAFDLPRACPHAGQRVRNRHAQIVVTVGRDNHILGARHIPADAIDHLVVFFGRAIANCIGDVQRGRAALDRDFQHLVEKLRVGARGIHWREFDVIAQAAGVCHHLANQLQRLAAALAELVLQVDIRGRHKGVNTLLDRRLDGRPAFVDVILMGARQAADHRPIAGADLLCDRVHRLPIAGRCCRKAGLDDIDP